jgi:hypothetical protein
MEFVNIALVMPGILLAVTILGTPDALVITTNNNNTMMLSLYLLKAMNR